MVVYKENDITLGYSFAFQGNEKLSSFLRRRNNLGRQVSTCSIDLASIVTMEREEKKKIEQASVSKNVLKQS